MYLHEWIHIHIYFFSHPPPQPCFKLRMTQAQANLWNHSYQMDSHFSSLLKPNWKPGWEWTGSHMAGWLPLYPPTRWFSSPAVYWALCAKAGWPWPSWLPQSTCPQRTMQSGSWQSAPGAHQALQANAMFPFPSTKSAKGKSQSSTFVSEKD